jgi:uncharacterized protein with PIN domain
VTLYLDTSSLVKLYVDEAGSEDVRDLVAQAAVVATSIVAYPETRAELARLRPSGDLSPAKFSVVIRGFDALHSCVVRRDRSPRRACRNAFFELR